MKLQNLFVQHNNEEQMVSIDIITKAIVHIIRFSFFSHFRFVLKRYKQIEVILARDFCMELQVTPNDSNLNEFTSITINIEKNRRN